MRLPGPQIRLGPLLSVDADDHAPVPEWPPPFVQPDAALRAQPAHAPVSSFDPVVDFVPSAFPQGALDCVSPDLPVLGMYHGLGPLEGRQPVEFHPEQA